MVEFFAIRKPNPAGKQDQENCIFVHGRTEEGIAPTNT